MILTLSASRSVATKQIKDIERTAWRLVNIPGSILNNPKTKGNFSWAAQKK